VERLTRYLPSNLGRCWSGMLGSNDLIDSRVSDLLSTMRDPTYLFLCTGSTDTREVEGDLGY